MFTPHVEKMEVVERRPLGEFEVGTQSCAATRSHPDVHAIPRTRMALLESLCARAEGFKSYKGLLIRPPRRPRLLLALSMLRVVCIYIGADFPESRF